MIAEIVSLPEMAIAAMLIGALLIGICIGWVFRDAKGRHQGD